MVQAQARDGILEAMPEEEGAALSTDQILGITGVKPTLGKAILKELFEAQIIQRNGKGVSGSPFQYWRPLVGRSEPPLVATDRPEEDGQCNLDNPGKVGRSLYRDEVATDQLSEPGGSASLEKSRSDGTITLYSDQQTLVVSDPP